LINQPISEKKRAMSVVLESSKSLAARILICLTPMLLASFVFAPAASGEEHLTCRSVHQVSELSPKPPAEGTYRIHLIDVATGLSVLVQGRDFNLLFDGGSNDDGHSGRHNRLLAYLFAALGPSGLPECVPDGDNWPVQTAPKKVIQHLVLSHPHKDHDDMLAGVLHCYKVENVWDSGVANPTLGYGQFLFAVADDPNVQFHTVVPIRRRKITVGSKTITFPENVQLTTFSENDAQTLGNGAKFTVLYADSTPHPSDYNRNSLVLRIDLGDRSLLLTGDTESSHRRDPSAPAGWVEETLVTKHRQQIHVDILQVGHHGSETSSRLEFLRAVVPEWALIGAGPKTYGGHVLPDPQIIDALNSLGVKIRRTDANDGHCPVKDRIGDDMEHSAGGCDNFLLEIAP
jgi:beta-lactamase superfamily II metal-dependent hydrolase